MKTKTKKKIFVFIFSQKFSFYTQLMFRVSAILGFYFALENHLLAVFDDVAHCQL